MAKIHGLVYIIIGILLVIASWKINFNELILFFYAGWLFVLVGIVKLLLGFGKKENRVQQKEQNRNVSHLMSRSNLHQTHHYKKCPRCGSVMRINDRFCSKCGLGV